MVFCPVVERSISRGKRETAAVAKTLITTAATKTMATNAELYAPCFKRNTLLSFAVPLVFFIKMFLMPGDYNDPESKVEKLGDNYNWTNKNRLDVHSKNEIEYAKDMIKQSFEKIK